jgi:hypothetical protein
VGTYLLFAGFLSGLLSLGSAQPAEAQLLPKLGVSIAYEQDGDSLEARVRLPLNLGVDVTLAFEEVLGLSPANVGLSARVLSVTDLLAIVSRLPAGLQVPSGFPVLLTIEPPAGGPLTFSGVATIEIHTHNLSFLPTLPLRFYAAPLGGSFTDITETMGAGSYRARGVKGGFSQFLVVVDTRPNTAVIDDKLSRLHAILDANEARITPAIYAGLQELADAASYEWTTNHDAAAARELVDELERTVHDHSGTAIPDVWRSSRDLVNAAGELRAAARTLRFSLSLQQ